ncbi:hypothetical protein AN964_22440 [Heyndrickxia shackletonii]|uniref:Uncharacterized protein n=1 Tax=Heyndrickxia shackletonii TaxID=157838 RepID=A0A0Q3WRC3_9BACI|nr:hypothetical protein [Heyndrickxia shackletonii]KQL50423.1 hypothetical protein AN964_22440 [Heyndrickxia shackletonii]NEZ00888.1 hypothetical protein [Heyndrickxia shackletonii]
MPPKLSYLVNLVVTVVCIVIFPMFILKSHPIIAFILGVIIATIINSILGARWRPWKTIKSN